MGAPNEGLDILRKFDDDIHPAEVPDAHVCICAGMFMTGGVASVAQPELRLTE